ncbi:MAG: hypothetical protein U0263_33540 [Polyangiaceae bacterium]
MPDPTALARSESPSFDRSLVLSALLFAACRFVPLPFADDLLRSAVGRMIVSRLLDQHGRTYSSSRVSSLYSEPGGCFGGCLVALPRFLAKLVLFPIRKILSWLFALRGVTRDLVTALLLGRTVERCLVRGLLPEGSDELALESRHIRLAFDGALEKSELGLSKAALTLALTRSKQSLGAAGRAVGAMFQKKPDAAAGEFPESERELVNQGADQVESALREPGVEKEIADFDQRFDAELERLRGA